MNLRIAYYVVAFAISLAAFTGAYGYASPTAYAAAISGAAADAAYDAADAARVAYATYTAYDAAYTAAIKADAADAAADAAFVTGYGVAGAVSLAAFARAYILDKRRTPPEG